MADHDAIHPDMSVDSALSAFPKLAEVFVSRGMACVGCSVSGFHTLKEAAAVYGIEWPTLLNELRLRLELTTSGSDPIKDREI